MSTALEEMHEIAPHIRVGRARAGVLMLIVSDSLSVIAILAAGGYLSALNTENQFRVAGDHAPTFLPGLLSAIALVLSGLAYYWWAQRAQKAGGTGRQIFFTLSWVFIIAALACQIWTAATLGYTSTPFDAYESLIMLLTWFSVVHLALTAIIGILLLGRILRGRLAGHEYIAEVTGYWWYYTVIATLIMWVFALFIA